MCIRDRVYNQSIQDLVKTPEAVINLTGKTSLNDLPGLFKEMDFAVGSDSGPMHIAAASDLPVISLWGATSPKRSAPWGSEHLVIASNLACSPCYKKDCPGLGTACMKGLRPERVLKAVDNL